MKFLLNNANLIFDNISNYFLVEMPTNKEEEYNILQNKMKKCIRNLEGIIKKSINKEKNSDKKMVYDYFIDILSLRDLLLKIYNIFYQTDKKQKYYSFYLTFEKNSTEKEKEVLKLDWFSELAKIRNLRIHEYEDLIIFNDDERLFFQHFNEIDYPLIISEFSDDRFYVDFSFYAIDKLNAFLNLSEIVFNKIVENNSVYSKEELKEKSQVYKIFNDSSPFNYDYDDIYITILDIKNNIDAETKQILKYLRVFEREETVLSNLIQEIEKGCLDELPIFYRADAYFQLSIVKYNNVDYKTGIELLWKCLNITYNSAILAHLFGGYVNAPDLLNDDIKIKLDKLIEIHTLDCFQDNNLDFFCNASSYFITTDRVEQALEMAKLGVNSQPFCHHVNLQYNYGVLLKKSNNLDNIAIAKNVFINIINLEPTDYLAYSHLIECYFYLKNYEGLNKSLKEAIRKFPQNLEFTEIQNIMYEYYIHEDLDFQFD